MKLVKRLAGLLMALVLMTSVLSFAEEGKTLYVNNEKIEASAVVSDEEIMIPLRGVCEALGMEVKWNGEERTISVSKEGFDLSFSPDKDSYILDGEEIILGNAAFIKEGITYVPANFCEKILFAMLEMGEAGLYITSPLGTVVNKVLCKEVNEEFLTVYDMLRGEVIVYVTEDTIIKNTAGEKIALADIGEGYILGIEYSAAMTMSIPPQTSAVKIDVLEERGFEVLKDTVSEVAEGQISIGDKEDVRNRTVLNVSEETIVLDANGNVSGLSAIKEDMEITVFASMATTFSIPPQKAAYMIRING